MSRTRDAPECSSFEAMWSCRLRAPIRYFLVTLAARRKRSGSES
ncbi:hypothetical protein [Actinomadura madurae]|nr:hypothetical protein [Actinomadura madurae]